MDLKIKYKGKNLSEAPETELNVNNDYYDMFQSELNNLLGFDKTKKNPMINDLNQEERNDASVISSKSNLKNNLNVRNKKMKKIKKNKKNNEKKNNIIKNKCENNSKENIITKSSSDSDIKLNIEENDYLAIKMMMKYFDI